MTKKANPGIVSESTYRTQDLVEKFMDVLFDCDPDAYQRISRDVAESFDLALCELLADDGHLAWNSEVMSEILNTDIALHPEGKYGMFLHNIPSGLEVMGNTVTGSALWYALRLSQVSNATIVGNTIKDVELGQWWSAAIYLPNSHDNRISGNNLEAVSGGWAGIMLLRGSSGNTLDHNHL